MSKPALEQFRQRRTVLPILKDLVTFYAYKRDRKPESVEEFAASDLLRFVVWRDLKHDGKSEAEISEILSDEVRDAAKDLKNLTGNKGHQQLMFTKERYELHD